MLQSKPRRSWIYRSFMPLTKTYSSSASFLHAWRLGTIPSPTHNLPARCLTNLSSCYHLLIHTCLPLNKDSLSPIYIRIICSSIINNTLFYPM